MVKKSIFLVLDNIRSRENVGSIFRTADAVGVSKIFLCGITPVPQPSTINRQPLTQDKIAKTALGAEKWVPWEYRKQTWRLLEQLRDNGLQLIALEKTKNSTNIFSARGGSALGGKFKPEFPLALVIGNEVKGLSPKILKLCDKIAEIPMFGKKESLNVSVAVGIGLYQLRHD